MEPKRMTQFLSGIELFSDLPTTDLTLFVEHFEQLKLNEGDLLFEENGPRKNLYIVCTGEIELFKKSALGEEKRLAYFHERDFLGEGALMDDYPHSTSARALTPATLLALSAISFRGLCEKHPTAGNHLLSRIAKVMSRRMRQAGTRVVNIAVQYISGRTRREHDLLGEREVPSEYYYGIQTMRALENFAISGVTLNHFPAIINGLAMVKMAAVRANRELDLIEDKLAEAIENACAEIINGKFHTQFVVDMIQGGAGTSTNMNANEVIANRALELLGYERGDYQHCHPNNHVNLSQSTNDAYPTAIKMGLYEANHALTGELARLVKSFREKSGQFSSVIKMGRTQLQDAVPLTLGQEFEAYAVTLGEEIERLNENANLFLEVHLGGTAIGTGINADPNYSEKAIRHLRKITGFDIRIADNLIESTQDTGAFVMYSSAIKRLAVKLSKISNDLRLLSSGPRAGLNEINLPAMQPGSSIMPGKVNPVIPEVVNQVAFKAIGNDLTVTLAAEAGQLQLNVMEPVIVQSIFESIEMLKNSMATLRLRCIDGITANVEHCRQMVQNSIGLVTALSPFLGHEVCDELAREALETNRGVYDLVVEKGLMSIEKLDSILDPQKMTGSRPATSD